MSSKVRIPFDKYRKPRSHYIEFKTFECLLFRSDTVVVER
jgi:hypothetical protein